MADHDDASESTSRQQDEESSTRDEAKGEVEPKPEAAPTPKPSSKKLLMGIAALLVAGLVWRWTSTQPTETPTTTSASSPEHAPDLDSIKLSTPIAAAHVGSDVIVAAYDADAKVIRAQRIDPKDAVIAEGVLLRDVEAGTDTELKVVARGDEGHVAGALMWRGLHDKKPVRELVMFEPKSKPGSSVQSLEPRGEVSEVPAASCATRDGLWFADGARALSFPFKGVASKMSLPKDKEASLLCAQHRAFAVLEEDERTSVLVLGADGAAEIPMVREADFGEDEQRELAEYSVGDDVGFVRLAASGAVAVRELEGTTPTPIKRLKRLIPRDSDVVAVDASSSQIVVVYTEDVADAGADDRESTACTRVSVIRIERSSFEESSRELAPPRCGVEVGPFFTSAVGAGAVSVAWAERASTVVGKPRAPIVGLSYATIQGAPTAPKRIDVAAEALVDAGCSSDSCYAAALVRSDSGRGAIKILRYK